MKRLEHDPDGTRPSANVLYRIAFALGSSVSELLEKQLEVSDTELLDIPEELRQLALAEHLNNEDIKVLARIEYRGMRPRTIDDWAFLYQAIKRSIRSER